MPDLTVYAKAIIAALFAAATAAQAVTIAGGFTTAAWLAIITAALGAIGTYAWPNTPTETTPSLTENPPSTPG